MGKTKRNASVFKGRPLEVRTSETTNFLRKKLKGLSLLPRKVIYIPRPTILTGPKDSVHPPKKGEGEKPF